MGEQDEAAGLLRQPEEMLRMGSEGRLEPLAAGFDRARRLGAGPAPAIHGPLLHGDLSQLVGSGHGAALGRGGSRIGAAKRLLVFRGTSGGLDGAIRGLDVPHQPLLPPFVLRARVPHHRAIQRPVEGDLALIGSLFRTFGDTSCAGILREGPRMTRWNMSLS